MFGSELAMVPFNRSQTVRSDVSVLITVMTLIGKKIGVLVNPSLYTTHNLVDQVSQDIFNNREMQPVFRGKMIHEPGSEVRRLIDCGIEGPATVHAIEIKSDRMIFKDCAITRMTLGLPLGDLPEGLTAVAPNLHFQSKVNKEGMIESTPLSKEQRQDLKESIDAKIRLEEEDRIAKAAASELD